MMGGSMGGLNQLQWGGASDACTGDPVGEFKLPS